MASQAALDLHNGVVAYLSGKLELHQLDDLIVNALVDSDNDPELAALAGDLHIELAQMADGHRSLPKFRMELASAIRPLAPTTIHRIRHQYEPPQIESSLWPSAGENSLRGKVIPFQSRDQSTHQPSETATPPLQKIRAEVA